MAFATADVVPTAGGNRAYKVGFAQGDDTRCEGPGSSRAEGHAQISKLLSSLRLMAENAGWLDH